MGRAGRTLRGSCGRLWCSETASRALVRRPGRRGRLARGGRPLLPARAPVCAGALHLSLPRTRKPPLSAASPFNTLGPSQPLHRPHHRAVGRSREHRQGGCLLFGPTRVVRSGGPAVRRELSAPVLYSNLHARSTQVYSVPLLKSFTANHTPDLGPGRGPAGARAFRDQMRGGRPRAQGPGRAQARWPAGPPPRARAGRS